MESGFRKDVLAIAVGTCLGAMLAHSLGYFWYLGVACGGFMGYLSRLLAEPQAITSACKRAWHVAKQLHLPENWWERVKFGFYTGVSVGGLAGVFMGSVVTWSDIGEPSGRVASNFGVSSSLALYILFLVGSVALFTILTLGLFLSDRNCYEFHKKNTNWKKWAMRLNPISIHLLAVYCVLKGVAWSISYAFWSLVWAVIHIPDFFIGTWGLLKLSACFVKLFFKFVHTEKFTACGVYASLGAFLVFIFIPNQPLVMVASSVISGYIGAEVRHFLLPRLNGSVVVKQP